MNNSVLLLEVVSPNGVEVPCRGRMVLITLPQPSDLNHGLATKWVMLSSLHTIIGSPLMYVVEGGVSI